MAYSVYVFLDNKNRPYYVGKTNNMRRRKTEHKEEILKGNKLPKYQKAISLINKGIPFKMVPIRKTKTETEAYRLERYYIKKYRKDGYQLMNCTRGGPDEIPMKINKPKKQNKKGIKIPTTDKTARLSPRPRKKLKQKNKKLTKFD